MPAPEPSSYTPCQPEAQPPIVRMKIGDDGKAIDRQANAEFEAWQPSGRQLLALMPLLVPLKQPQPQSGRQIQIAWRPDRSVDPGLPPLRQTAELAFGSPVESCRF